MLPTLVFPNPSNSKCYANSVSIDWTSTFSLLNGAVFEFANSAFFVVTVLSHIAWLAEIAATPRKAQSLLFNHVWLHSVLTCGNGVLIDLFLFFLCVCVVQLAVIFVFLVARVNGIHAVRSPPPFVA